MMHLLQSLLNSWQGSRTYLASAVLAGLGALLLATGSDSTFAVFLLAQGGGLAALRSAVARVQAYLTTLQDRLDAAAKVLG